MQRDEALARQAAAFGVADRYHSFWGEDRQVPDAVLQRALQSMGAQGGQPPGGFPAVHVVRVGEQGVLRWPAPHGHDQRWHLQSEDGGDTLGGLVRHEDGQAAIHLPPDLAPGYWRLAVDGLPQDAWCRLVVAPARCWLPAGLQQGERWWGCTVQLYALRSGRNWGIGDFGDLRRLVEAAAAQGASFIGLSPLHALFPHNPEAASPYSPSSRQALNTLYLDVQSLVELGGCKAARERVQSEDFQQRLRSVREAELVDYRAVAALKEEVLQLLWQAFERDELGTDSSRASHFRSFARQRAATLGRHAAWEALQAWQHARDPHAWGWPAWPQELHDPAGEAVRAFEREHASQVQYRLWLQWLAELQLESVQRYARSRGMGIGLYCDLAVGVNDGGSETWMQPGLYALGMRIGAPPDPLAALGQDWGLPPWNPHALRAARHEPFIATLRANMRHAGALRLDHVMALMRLFWTSPDGGTYVAYPLDELLGILALESHRQQCMVIGEDLGNVAPRMREAMHGKALLSYRPLLFERSDDGSFRPPAQWQAQALAVVSTHDLPTLRGFWLGEDIEVAARLALYPDEGSHAQQVVQRAQDRARLLLALQQEGLLPEGASVQPTSLPDATPGLVDAVHAYLARTPCWLVGVQLEDVMGQVLQVNVPGTTEDRFPNWRRRLPVRIEDLPGDARWASLAAALRAERSGPATLDTAGTELPDLATADVPLATYRVQFHQGFGFAAATEAVPYLAALGISHLYSSPYLRARPGSTHGYDIVDHGALNPEVGDAAAHERLCLALQRHGMGQILDVVPNHMGVLEADNAWWLDVLEHGQASAHARSFDIEWHPAAPEMAGRLLLPVLGDHYGRVLEAGEIRLDFDAAHGSFDLRYWNHRFPVDPAHYPDIFAVLPAPPARDEAERDSHAVVEALLGAFARLPSRDTASEDERRVRRRDAAVHKRSLARLATRHEWLAQWLAACVARINGQPGEAASFDALDALLARQAYRLADWRVASDDVNYRRFFDVNTLAALRMEQPEVFEATHRKVLHWLQEGWLGGLRIDHPDGLSQPRAYFRQLQQRHAQQAVVAGREPRALYLLVEKIQAEHEALPEPWPVHGDTGYRFGSIVNGLFVDGRNEEALTAFYREFSGRDASYEETVHACKIHIIETSLFSELGWLTEALHRITRADRRRCDFTRNRLRVALMEVAANFPVYRTYLEPGEPPSAQDRRHVDWAVAGARRRLGGSEASVLQHLREVLLAEAPLPGVPPEEHARFVARWQQFTAPVMAKAVEDTAFYRYLRLVSLNEVGGEPASFGLSVAAFHNANQGRQRHRPHCLLGTSTHDSKRGEDLRARISVLSEAPQLWQDCLRRWSGWAELYLTAGPDGPMPCRNDIWLLFQTLVGLWPAPAPDAQAIEALRARIQAYMLKAVREAKLHTRWTCPEQAYEDALARYVDAIVRPGPIAEELGALAARLAPFGFRNSLSQLALKLTAPGVPDIYQGCEDWNFSLVDPDNRRPVDFARLAASLATIRPLYEGRWPAASDWRALQEGMADGRIKQLVTWRLLALRRAQAALFRDGSYLPLAVEGPLAEHAVAFARCHGDATVVVVATRLAWTLCSGDAAACEQAPWGQARVDLGPLGGRGPGRWRDWCTGSEVAVQGDDAAHLPLAPLFANADALPFAVLVAPGGR